MYYIIIKDGIYEKIKSVIQWQHDLSLCPVIVSDWIRIKIQTMNMYITDERETYTSH